MSKPVLCRLGLHDYRIVLPDPRPQEIAPSGRRKLRALLLQCSRCRVYEKGTR